MYKRGLMTAAAVLLLSGTAALADTTNQNQSTQSQSNQGQMNQSQMQSQAGPQDFTCAQLVTMDTAQVPGVLYYISGYNQGLRDTGNYPATGSNTTSSTGTSNTGTSNTGTSSAGTSSTGTSNTGTSSTGTSSTGTSSATGSSGSASTGNASGTAATGSTTGSASSGSASNPDVYAVSGYFEIPVERVVLACGDDLNKSVSELLEQESRSAGGSDSPTGGTKSN